MSGIAVAVAGATGVVGRVMLEILAERRFPAREVIALASPRSEGKRLAYAGGELTVRQLTADSFRGIDLALFSAGAERAREFAPAAVRAGATVVDNSSAFRMDPDVPLVVPEVNPESLRAHKGIIANPNCSTIQMVVALKPLHEAARIRRIVVSTYQAVSGAGQGALDELRQQVKAAERSEEAVPRIFSHPIAFNCLPQIDAFLEEGGATREEEKMVQETRKILGEPELAVSVTCVRVPVYNAHSESLNVEFERPLPPEEARGILSRAPGVRVVDDPAALVYPMALDATGRDPVYVGRIRRDPSAPNALNLWVVADNLRKGAALNAVQLGERLVADGLLKAA
ncbi:MAG: aspartate-semialdehyde dehydrogenase [bacterium]